MPATSGRFAPDPPDKSRELIEKVRSSNDVALLTAKRADIATAGDLYGAAEFLYLLVFGFLAAFGAGVFSLDGILARRFVPAEKPRQVTVGEKAA